MTIRTYPKYDTGNFGHQTETTHACVSVAVFADTLEEAEQAKRAFENVLAPRFTRDEAIAIVRHAADGDGRVVRDAFNAGIRLALEALAAAGVFSDRPEDACDRNALTMSDKLDAAGIR